MVLMYMSISLHVCPWNTCMPSTHEGQKKVLDAILELEIMMFWAIMWAPGVEPGSSEKQTVFITPEPAF